MRDILTERRLKLIRVSTCEDGTFGVLIDGAMPFALTLEPPWVDNAKDISCIPPGEYYCESINSVKFGYTFKVQDVPDRTNILFHRGNWEKDTKGCICIGEQFESNGVLASAKGFKEFTYRLRGCESFTLDIEEHWE